MENNPAPQPTPAPAAPAAGPQPVVGSPFAKPAGAAPAAGGNKKGLIIGISVGAAVVLIGIIVLIIVLVAGGGKTISCEMSKDYGESAKQKGGVTFKFDKEDKLTGASMWEETWSSEEISDSDFESAKKSYEDYDKDKYEKFELSRVDAHTVRIDIEMKASAKDTEKYKTPEDAKKYAEGLGFTCKE